MPRPSFTTVMKVPGSYTQESGYVRDNSGDGVIVKEVVGRGTIRRRKPTNRFIPPVGYSLDRLVTKYSEGRVDERIMTKSGLFVATRTANGALGRSTSHMSRFNEPAFDGTYLTTAVSNASLDRALTRARIKMKKSDVNLGVAFAERNKTAKLVGDTAKKLVASVRALRKGDFSGAARELGLKRPRREPHRGMPIPNKWLELQYGWKPLLQDVYGATDALARRHNDDWMVTAKASDLELIKAYQAFNRVQGGFCTVQGVKGSFVRIDAIPQNDLLLSFKALGITNPALIGWELVPFSFVVDWFLPVGDFLEQLDAMLGYGPSWSSRTKFQKVRWLHKLNASTTDHDSYFDRFQQVSCTPGIKHFVSVDRVAGAGVPLATIPRFKDPFSLGHMANGLSLLASVFGSRR